MILSKLYKSKNEDLQGVILASLATGLLCGILFGIVFGLLAGLTIGLLCGLLVGLLAGLTIGLLFTLSFTMFVGIGAGVLNPWWLFLLLIIGIGEILYWADKEKKPKDAGRWSFTIRKKVESILEVSLVVVNIMNVVAIFQRYNVPQIIQNALPAIEKAIYYIGIAVVVIGAIAVWLWLNSLKYKTKHKKR